MKNINYKLQECMSFDMDGRTVEKLHCKLLNDAYNITRSIDIKYGAKVENKVYWKIERNL